MLPAFLAEEQDKVPRCHQYVLEGRRSLRKHLCCMPQHLSTRGPNPIQYHVHLSGEQGSERRKFELQLVRDMYAYSLRLMVAGRLSLRVMWKEASCSLHFEGSDEATDEASDGHRMKDQKMTNQTR